MFSYEFCKILGGSFFIEHLWATASVYLFALEFRLVFWLFSANTAQKMKFSIKDFFSKCDQIRRKLWIWSHLLKKSLMENFMFCAVKIDYNE